MNRRGDIDIDYLKKVRRDELRIGEQNANGVMLSYFRAVKYGGYIKPEIRENWLNRQAARNKRAMEIRDSKPP